jgi:hypothetical protein
LLGKKKKSILEKNFLLLNILRQIISLVAEGNCLPNVVYSAAHKIEVVYEFMGKYRQFFTA